MVGTQKGSGLFSGGGWDGILARMPRPKRVCPAGEVFHVLNRAVARLTIFEKPGDYDAFLRVLDETWREVSLPIFAMVLMPNHWHFVVRPTADDQVSAFFRRLTGHRQILRGTIQPSFLLLPALLIRPFLSHTICGPIIAFIVQRILVKMGSIP